MAPHMRAELVEGALAMAISSRKPKGRVEHHSDRGSQYTSLAFGKRCREAGIVQSMGADARREVFGFIEGFYNKPAVTLCRTGRAGLANAASIPPTEGGRQW